MASFAVEHHIAGGYFVARSTPGSPPWMPAEFGVTRSISASSELVPLFPTPTWVNDFDVAAAAFGLRADQLSAAGQFADELFDAGRLGFPDVFIDMSDAHAFYDRFAADRNDVIVIGVGLPPDHAYAFLTEVGQNSVSERLARREPLATAGRSLGYELLGMDVPPFESWAVRHYPAKAREQLGIAIDEDGLIPSLDDAIRATEFFSEVHPPSGGFSLGRFNFRPWLLVQYSP